MVLFRSHLRQEARALAGWSVAVAALALLQTSLFEALQKSVVVSQLTSALHHLPAQFVQFVGGSLDIYSAAGWVGAMDLSGWLTLIVGIWLALAAVSVVARDVDHRTLEFLLSLPVRRGRLLAERSLSLVLQLLALYIVIFLGVIVALAFIGARVNDLRLAEALGMLFLQQTALAGTLVLVSLFLRDQTSAMLATVTAAAVFIFIPVFIESNSRMAFLRHLTPFDYEASGSLMLHGTYPGSQVALAAIWAVAAFVAAWAIFARQEV